MEWMPEAVTAALHASGGYPFFVQSCGKFIWDYAKSSPITIEDAEVGIAFARREIDAGLYLARWNRATKAQRQILRAMASEGEGATVATADIALMLGKKRGDISVPRDQLIKKGLIYAPERGLVSFTVPGMVDFINRQPD
ncbi:MAG: MarR family transcriptional regulator [Actinobacteria bacterium]|nr:MarR family transcriptional regulator [Actinomycetota bacterium]